jgi:hypothetical protein
MACESAAAAIEPLAAWAAGASSLPEARQVLSRRLDDEFTSRLRTAAILQRAIVHPAAHWLLFQSVKLIPAFQGILFQKTR